MLAETVHWISMIVNIQTVIIFQQALLFTRLTKQGVEYVTGKNFIYRRSNCHRRPQRPRRAVSSDNALNVQLSTPRELGGADGPCTNPEQLFAAGYSACFLGALKYVAAQNKIALPSTTQITGKVGIGPVPTGFTIQVELNISLYGLAPDQARALVDKAHIVCPYSNATRGNIEVALDIIN